MKNFFESRRHPNGEKNSLCSPSVNVLRFQSRFPLLNLGLSNYLKSNVLRTVMGQYSHRKWSENLCLLVK